MSRFFLPALRFAMPVGMAAATAIGVAAPAIGAPAVKPASAVLTEQQLILPADGPYVISLANVRGPVVVRGWNKNVLYVKAEKRATHPLSGTEAQLYAEASVTLDRPEPGTVAIATRFPSQDKTSPGMLQSKAPHVEVAYTIMLPPEAALTLQQESGAVTLVGASGRLKAVTRDGAIAVANTTGRVEVANERGDIRLANLNGDASAQTLHGQIYVQGAQGDLEAKTTTGDVWVTVPARFAADVSYHTVRGLFRSDLATFQTNLLAGDTGYVGVLRGPLAMGGAPELRYKVDTVSGTLQIAAEQAASR
jgi:hypothetical protein